ncbi:protein phosphatase 2C-like protein [Saccharothrix saharensis]|uniref:Protein phosphatase 2C-like protein n=1 Tax=Saccharothrix saharensis TaxID=571190 RepID=A0A543JC68_9PSEU|nr:protein phosphatase 2C-like protein [Saccharothrix saharensis]
MFRGASLSSDGSSEGGQDRWAASERHAVVLDGASSFTPAVVDASEYVDQLCAELTSELRDGDHDLVAILGTCISAVASRLSLRPAEAPSSTVLLARERGDEFNLLVLGDSTAVVSVNGEISRTTDDRLASVGGDLRRRYRSRLAAGTGYDDEHRQLLRLLQEQELTARNTLDGYWIAEADRQAAKEAVVQTFALADLDWCVLATDGVQRPIDHLGMHWPDIAGMTAPELSHLLADLHHWEENQDPDGAALPRSKRHDDKAIVVWTPTRS